MICPHCGGARRITKIYYWSDKENEKVTCPQCGGSGSVPDFPSGTPQRSNDKARLEPMTPQAALASIVAWLSIFELLLVIAFLWFLWEILISLPLLFSSGLGVTPSVILHFALYGSGTLISAAGSFVVVRWIRSAWKKYLAVWKSS